MERATVDSIGLSAKPENDEARQAWVEMQKNVNAYLQVFAASSDCPDCGRPLGGLFGAFTFDIAHGEGRCSNCSWPCRALHYIGDSGEPGKRTPSDDPGHVLFLEYVLPYHEDNVKRTLRS